MATTFIEYNGDGNNNKAFSFPSYQVSDVKVQVDDVLKTVTTHYNITNYTTTGGGTVVFTSGNIPAAGTLIRIYRDTAVDTAKATYTAGASVKAGDLNNNQTQALYALQEEQNQLITTTKIRAGAVTLVKLAADSVDGTKIKDDAINSEHYAANSIDTEHYAPNSIDTNAIADNTIDSSHYVDGSIDLVHMSANSVSSDQYVDNSILTAHIGTGQVTTDQIAASTIVDADISGSAAIAGSKLVAATTSAPGSMSAADKTKLDGIETAATADQTNAEIRAAVEAASDSNVFTDADHTKLNAIEASADVTDATNVNAAGAVMNSDLDGKGELLVGDGSGDPTALPVGTNGYILKADSSEATGVKWAAAGAGGDVNQNAFSNVAVSGQTTVAADTATDTLTIVGGTNVTVTTDASADSVTIAASGGEVTVQNDGSSLSTAATTLNFTGAGVTASGTGATKTITISGGGGNTSTDFKYLALRNEANNGAASYPASDFTLVTSGTTTALTPAQANALIVSYGGVIQQPNTGTGTPTTGFAISGSTIKFGSAITAAPDFIIYLQGAGVASIGDNTVTGAKIALGSDAAGDVMYYNGTDYVRLAKGTNGHYLKQGTSNAPEWAAVSQYTTPLTTRGDILFRDASGDQRLAKGTDGQFLKIGANDPVWADVVGAVANGCIYENDQTISADHTIASGKGAHSVGPITVNATVTVNGNWVVS